MTRTLLAAFLALGVAVSAEAQPAFKVRRRDLATVYLDLGLTSTLRVGDRLRVMAGEATIAELEVVHVVIGSAACREISATRPVVARDVAVLVTRPANPLVRAATGIVNAPPAPPPSPSSMPPAVSAPARTAAIAPPAAPSSPSAVASPAPVPSASPMMRTLPPVPSRDPRDPAVASLEGARSGGSGNGGGSHGGGNGGGGHTTVAAVTPALVTERAPVRVGRREFRVKYRSAANAYIDAGEPDGLSLGDLLRVVAGKDPVAELEVVHLSEQSASCRIVSEKRPVRVGDAVVRVGGGPPTPAMSAIAAANTGVVTAAPAVTQATARTNPPANVPATAVPLRHPVGRWARVRGSASFGYMRSWDRTALALDLEQRTARLDVGVYDIAGQPLSFSLRVRSRQDLRARALSLRTPQQERNDRVYEMAVRYQPSSDRYGLELGRIGLYRFVGIGYVDGALARHQVLPHLELGGFAGRDAEVDGFSTAPTGSGMKYGGFVRLVPGGRYGRGGYDATLAFVREMAASEVSREYLSLESRIGHGSRWSLSERAELDLNRGWRQELTSRSQQLSNASVSGNLRLSASASAFASYDGRRNYRYERNRLVSQDLFDDLFHQGLRAGLNVARPEGLGLTIGGGMRLRSPDPRHPELNLANAYSANAGLRHAGLFGRSVSIGLDGSGFTNGYTSGGVASANLGKRFGTRHYVDLSYGRSLYRVTLTGQDRVTEWRRVMGRFELGRHVYVVGDFSYDSGDDVDGIRGFVETGFVF